MDAVQQERFTKLLREGAEECRRIGYNPRKFLQMLAADGGYATAQKLLASPRISDGFVELSMLGRLDLSVEALVLEHGWGPAFDTELVNRARKRLIEAGYRVRSPEPAGNSKGNVSTEVSASEGARGNGSNGQALVEGLKTVLEQYLKAAREPFKEHKLAAFIRQDLASILRSLVIEKTPRLLVKGSAGQGVWARGPWLGVFDPLVTDGAQSGFYPCFLFREDMGGLYLSLNQGMTEAKENYRSDAKTALKARAQNYRALLGDAPASFPELSIDLAPSSAQNDTAFYEAANIFAKFYSATSLRKEELLSDLGQILDLYQSLVEAEARSDDTLDEDGDTPIGLSIEDGTKFRIHKRIERNSKLAKQVKQHKGCVCEVCGLDFSQRYGAIGQGYIEAHHLQPLASLKGMKAVLDPRSDFAVLCSNCHRMVHRSGLLADIERFRTEVFLA